MKYQEKDCCDTPLISKKKMIKIIGSVHIMYIILFIMDGVLFGSDLSFGRFCRDYLICCPLVITNVVIRNLNL